MMFLETLKIVDGRFQNLQAHEKRMLSTVGRRLWLPTEVPVHCRHGVVKCRVVYDAECIHEVSYTPYTLPTIMSLRVIECATLDYHLKYADRTAINHAMEKRGGCDDVLITQNGKITDSSFCNLVFENSEGLFIPTTYLLNGTKRQKLLASELVTEREITITDLPKYDRVRLINAILDLDDGVCVERSNIIF